MTIKVLFFANFKELLDTARLDVEIKSGATVRDLCHLLAKKGGVWHSLFDEAQQKVKVSINQDMAEMTHILHNEDEVAFFPPVTGG